MSNAVKNAKAIIITVIVAYTCMNLAELVNMYSEAIGKAITQINAGF